MKKAHFNVDISAPKEKVWKVLWNDDTYRKWTSVFSEGSYAETDWKEGSKVRFLSPGGDGMYSTIARNEPYTFMSIKHIGVVKGGKELPLDDETKKWSGALENYTLKETNGSTQLEVDMDITDDFWDYFSQKFPVALGKVKELAEN